MAGGYTLTLPDEDRYIIQRSKMEQEMSKMLGGRAAEEIVFNEISTGASDDLDKSTKLARSMVMRYGMSDKLGPLVYGRKEELVFLGKEIGEQRDYSEALAQEIDDEVRQFVTDAYERAKGALREHRDELDRVVVALLDLETLSAEEFEAVMGGRALPERKKEPPASVPDAAEPVLKPSAAVA